MICILPYRQHILDLSRYRATMVEVCWKKWSPMESCWGSLKTELVHHRHFVTREQAKRATTEHIEIFYNRMRKQARLCFL